MIPYWEESLPIKIIRLIFTYKKLLRLFKKQKIITRRITKKLMLALKKNTTTKL